jgi:hypothetical protein
MTRDVGFWVVIGLYALFSGLLWISAWRFTADNPFARSPWADAARQDESPQLARAIVRYTTEAEMAFFEMQVGAYVKDSVRAVLSVSLLSVVILMFRQHRLMKRIETLEASRHTPPDRPAGGTPTPHEH